MLTLVGWRRTELFVDTGKSMTVSLSVREIFTRDGVVQPRERAAQLTVTKESVDVTSSCIFEWQYNGFQAGANVR